MISSIIEKTENEVKVVCGYGSDPKKALIAYLEQREKANYNAETYIKSEFYEKIKVFFFEQKQEGYFYSYPDNKTVYSISSDYALKFKCSF